MTATIETLRVRETERRAADTAAVTAAARALAAGKDVSDVGALEAALAGAGVTVEAFDRLVAWHKERAADRKLLAARPAAEAAAERATKAFTKAKAEAVAALEVAERNLARLELERASAAADVAAADAARDRLIRGATGEVVDRHRDAVATETAATEAMEVLRATIRESRDRAAHHAWRATDVDQHVGDIEEHKRRAAKAERAVKEAEAAIPEAEAAIEAARAARRRAEADAIEQ